MAGASTAVASTYEPQSAISSSGVASPAATRQWTDRYNGYAHKGGGGYALAVDSGNSQVYVLGSTRIADTVGGSSVIMAYDTAGTRLWVTRTDEAGGTSSASAVVVDPANHHIYVIGDGSQGGVPAYATVAYDADGRRLWAATYAGNDRYSDVQALAVDPINHNVYVTGSVSLGISNDKYTTVAYNAAGTQLWAADYGWPNNRNYYPAAMAVDAANHQVYVTGTGSGPGRRADYLTLAYDATGTQLWAVRYDSAAHRYSDAQAVAVDPGNHHVYVFGTSNGFRTVAYDADGTMLWSKVYLSAGAGYDIASAAAVDTGNHLLYVTGKVTSPAGDEIATLAYNPAGQRLWLRHYLKNPGFGPYASEAYSLAVNPSTHRVYVAGGTESPLPRDLTTLAYDGVTGHSMWVGRYNGPAHGDDLAEAVAVNPVLNQVYVTGGSAAPSGEYDCVTMSYPG